MNTRQTTLILCGVFLCLLVAKVQANPNHLEPIPPSYNPLDLDGTRGEYNEAVFTSLIGRGWLPSLWMIEKPSSSRAYAVVLQRTVEFDPNDTRPFSEREIKRKPWVVSYTALNEEIRREKIWRSKAANGRIPITYEIRPTKNVESHSAPITPEFAKAVQEAWLSTLQLTRYAQGDRGGGLDGTTLDFFCCDDPFTGGRFGQTWSPTTGLPALLADLGRKLRAVALADEKNRESLLAEADRLARKIVKDAAAEQIRLFGKKMSHAH